MRAPHPSALLIAFAVSLAAGCETPAPTPTPAATTTAAAPTQTGISPAQQGIADRPAQTATAAPAEQTPPETIAAQHVLVAYSGAKGAPVKIKRTKADAKKRAEEVAAKAKKGDDFTELVKVYSDEPGAIDRLGNLGKFKREAMVKPFSDAAFALKVNETSEVVETEFGFHVIKRNQ